MNGDATMRSKAASERESEAVIETAPESANQFAAESSRESVANLSLGSLTPVEQQQITEILDQYLQAIENGEKPNVQTLLKKHLQWEPILKRYFESLGVLHDAAQAMNGPASILLPTALTEQRRLGDYEIRRQIGRGGMGIVYEARQVSLDRKVALKVLPLAAVLDQRQIARFRREAQAAAQLHHPNVVPVFGVGCEEGIHFYSMQLVDGQSIDRVIGSIRTDSTLPLSRWNPDANETTTAMRGESTIEELGDRQLHETAISEGNTFVDRRYIDRVAELGIQAASGIQHAHDYGVVHRDIKPSNLMLDRDGKLWVTDFGLAHIQSEADMTATGDIVGTLRYMSPEQARGKEVIDQRTDIYSLGVTLYEMLTLKQAMPATERPQLLRDIEMLEPRPVRKINPAIPLDLETIIMKATAKQRDQRYSRAQDLADDLQRYLDGKPTLARRPTLLDLGTKWAHRHRGLVALCVVMLTLALIGTSASLLMIQTQKAKTDIQKQRADAHRDEATDALEKITEHSKLLTKQIGVQRDIHRVARDVFRSFVEQAEITPERLANTHARIGGMSEQLGEYAAAVASYRDAADLYRELITQDSKHVTAFALVLNNLGQTLAQNGKHEDALECYETALHQFEQFKSSVDPSNPDVQHITALLHGNVGYLLSRQGPKHHEAANSHLLKSVELRRQILADSDPLGNRDLQRSNQIRLASNYHNLSSMLVDVDVDQSLQYCHLAISLQQAVATESYGDINPRRDLALSYNNLGTISLRKQDLHQALKHYETATRIGRSLVREAPDLPQLVHDFAVSLNNLGMANTTDQDAVGAIAAFREAEQQFASLPDLHRNNVWTRVRWSGTLCNLAEIYRRSTRPDLEEAAKLFRRAIDMQKDAVRQAPASTQYVALLKNTSSEYGKLLRRMDQHEALTQLNKELAPLLSKGESNAR